MLVFCDLLDYLEHGLPNLIISIKAWSLFHYLAYIDIIIVPVKKQLTYTDARAYSEHCFSPFRIKMPCASVNENELLTVIHEMGHIQYDIMYSKQPYSFRNGANPAFHEAVGDALTLSARTTSFLKTVGLMDENFVDDEETGIYFEKYGYYTCIIMDIIL